MSDGVGGGWRGRGVAAVALTIVGALSLTVALMAGWAQRTVFDKDEFATRTVSMLDSSAVRRALAEEITNELIENGSSSLASYRTALEGVVSDVLTTDGFRAIFHNALEQAHRAVFQRNGAVALLELGETLKLLSEHASTTNDSLASRLPSATGSLLIDVTPTVRRLELWRFANDVRWLDEVSLALAAIAFGGAVAIARRRSVFIMIGIGVAAAGIVVVLAAEIIPDVAVNTIHDQTLADAVASGVSRFVVDLKALGLWTIPFGIILAGAAEASERSDGLRFRAWIARQRDWQFAELSRPGQIGLGAATLAAGILVLVIRHQIVALAVVVGAFFAVYLGAVLLIRALLGPVPESSPAPRRRLPRRVLIGTTAAIAAILLAGALVTSVTTASGEARERGTLVCNGSEDLCDRRLNHVAFAGSHNSMSAEADPGWLFAENINGIPAQLEYGIRALLIKSHYGISSGIDLAGVPLVVTDKAAEITTDPEDEASELGTDAVKTVDNITRTVGRVSGAPELYLCHGYCELGATKFAESLDAIRQFMNRNPNDVLIMIIGDFITPADTATAFKNARLINRVWTYDHDRRSPTLRRMIEAKRTLFVLAEHEGGSPPWYNSAYLGKGVFQDTPYTFATPSQFSCAPNRGPADAPLFQINHWITNSKPPNPKQARSINSFETLMGRVRECEQAREQFPTIIGVNFYDQGDLLKVVDRLNEHGRIDDS